MRSWEREVHSHLDLVERFARLAGLPEGEAHLLVAELRRYMRVRLAHRKWLPGEITRFHSEWYRELYRTLDVADPYVGLKERSDALARELLDRLVLDDPRETLVAALVANRLDFGAVGEDGVRMPVGHEDFANLAELPLLYDDSASFLARVASAERLLYLLDNHGEARFDLSLIRRLRALHPRLEVVVAAKSGPMINDVTAAEARGLGFSEVATVVSTGTNGFGVPEDEVSAAFLEAFAGADLVLAKGQAQLEFWIERSTDKVVHAASTKFAIHDEVLGTLPARAALVLDGRRYRSAAKRPYPDPAMREGRKS